MYVCTYVHTYLHTYVHTYVCMYVCTYVCTYIRTYVHSYVHTYIHTLYYIHTLQFPRATWFTNIKRVPRVFPGLEYNDETLWETTVDHITETVTVNIQSTLKRRQSKCHSPTILDLFWHLQNHPPKSLALTTLWIW